jgi:hypothetical protein
MRKLENSWRSVNNERAMLTEQEVLAKLTAERIGQKRVSILERLHQRYNTLRVTRERLEILGEAKAK